MGVLGRKRLFDDADLVDLHNEITEAAISLSTKNISDVKKTMQSYLLRKRGFNDRDDPNTFAPLSDKSVRQYLKLMKASEDKTIGVINPQPRVQPFLNIRNVISKAAGLTSISEQCPTVNIFSEDEVGIFLFKDDSTKKPVLVSSQVADEFLRENNVSLSTRDDRDERRAAHIGATVQAHTGHLNSYYLRIADSRFPDTDVESSDSAVHRPRVWPLNTAANFFVVTCHPSVTDTTISECIGKLITHPAIFACQDATIKSKIASRRFYKSLDISKSTAVRCEDTQEEVDIREFYKWTTLIRDWAPGQINVSPELDRWNIEQGRQMFMAKWPAGCSMREAKDDLGYTHSILKGHFSSRNFQYSATPDPPGQLYQNLKTYLRNHLESSSFHTFWQCICSMEGFMTKAFTSKNARSALQNASFECSTLTTSHILGSNYDFAKLSQADADNLLRLMDLVFVPYWRDHGIIRECIFEEVFAGEENIDTLNSIPQGNPFHEMAINPQRFQMDNQAHWKAEVARRKAMEIFAAEEKERQKVQKEQEQEQEQAVEVSMKGAKYRQCAFMGCPNAIDITTAALKRTNESTWSKCRGKGCRVWVCFEHRENLPSHQSLCQFNQETPRD